MQFTFQGFSVWAEVDPEEHYNPDRKARREHEEHYCEVIGKRNPDVVVLGVDQGNVEAYRKEDLHVAFNEESDGALPVEELSELLALLPASVRSHPGASPAPLLTQLPASVRSNPAGPSPARSL